jgi:hypothetical protein
MSAPVRFLFVAVAGWTLFRGITGGIIPTAEAFTVPKAEAAPPAIVPTEFPALTPIQPQPPAMPPEGAYASYPPGYGYYPPQPRYIPIYYPATAAASRTVTVPLPPAQQQQSYEQPPEFYAPIAPLEGWDLAQVARGGFSRPAPQSSPAPAEIPNFIPQKHLDRLQLSTWALLRREPGTGSLASGGILGGSQAGARLTYAFDRRLAASLRTSSPVGGARGGEIAAGVRVTPIPSIPFSLTAERRQAIGKFSTGRSAFALFAEGGVYQQPLGWNLLLDGYAQAGVVGVRSRDLFVDGGFAVSRPVYDRFSAGFGVWGGYQPGLYRIDAGPRLSMRVRRNVSLHLDWRQRVSGTAQPGSGPAITLGADF